MYKFGKTAHAIATLLHFRTIGIKNTIFKVCTWHIGWLNHQELIKTNAEITVGQTLNGQGIQISTLADQINHHKVIAQTMHLGKF